MSILGEHFFKTSNAIYSYGLVCILGQQLSLLPARLRR